MRSRVAASLGDYVNDYTYDANKRMASITQDDKRVEYSYNAAGQRDTMTASFAEHEVYETLYDYDGMGRLKSIAHQNDDGVIANYDYS